MTAKVAVIGCGYWGKNLVRNMHVLGALGAIVESDAETAARFAAEYQVPAPSFDDVLTDEGIDGVVVTLPAHLHHQACLRALEAGKHVFVEKPIALNVTEAQEIIAAAERHDRRLMVGHLLQYHPAFLALKALVDEGRLGELRYLYSNRLNLGKLRTEEDALWSFAPHDISMILALAGEEPTSVVGFGGAFLQPLSDVATLHLEFPGGARGHVFVSWLHPTKEQKLVAIGSRAMAVFDDRADWPEKLAVYAHTAEIVDGVPALRRADAEFVPLATGEPLKAECQHFLDSIANRTTPRTDGHEALRVLKVLTAGTVGHERA